MKLGARVCKEKCSSKSQEAWRDTGRVHRIARSSPRHHVVTSSRTRRHAHAPAHAAIRVRQFLAQRSVTVINHPPYSPDLAPADFFLFPRLKIALKGTHFEDLYDIQESVTKTLQTILAEAFSGSFHKLFERCQRCIEGEGDYFEGQ